jgi:xylulokinase
MGGLAPDAPLTLIGGGAQGAAWQSVTRRLSGRPVRIAAGGEFVALGAAAQAAAVLEGLQPAVIARRWRGLRDESGEPLPPATPADTATLSRHREIRNLTAAALTRGGTR